VNGKQGRCWMGADLLKVCVAEACLNSRPAFFIHKVVLFRVESGSGPRSGGVRLRGP
jgi:hypothetical protein